MLYKGRYSLLFLKLRQCRMEYIYSKPRTDQVMKIRQYLIAEKGKASKCDRMNTVDKYNR